MKLRPGLLRSLIKEEMRRLVEQAEERAADFDCPPATQDLRLNTKNRDSAIKAKHIQYGPLNPSDEDYWERIAKHWKTTPDVAKESNCSNCAAFDISPRMAECMPGELMTWEEIQAAMESGGEWETLGYCWMHHFKCHSARTCYTWAAGPDEKPIIDDPTSYDWHERSGLGGGSIEVHSAPEDLDDMEPEEAYGVGYNAGKKFQRADQDDKDKA